VPASICCDLAAQNRLCVPVEEVPQWRRQPGPGVPTSFLKQSDEQTVVALAAVRQAIEQPALAGVDFRDWGVLAVPRFLGRSLMGHSLRRFQAEGAWGVSPHVIPHRSLHAVSGTISTALKIQGPNFGVAGGPNGAAEGLFSALSLMANLRLPGVWLVLTAPYPELPPTADGEPPPGTSILALALALTSPNLEHRGLHLGISWKPGPSAPATDFDLRCLLRLLDNLHPAQASPGAIRVHLGSGAFLEITHRGQQALAWPELRAA